MFDSKQLEVLSSLVLHLTVLHLDLHTSSWNLTAAWTESCYSSFHFTFQCLFNYCCHSARCQVTPSSWLHEYLDDRVELKTLERFLDFNSCPVFTLFWLRNWKKLQFYGISCMQNLFKIWDFRSPCWGKFGKVHYNLVWISAFPITKTFLFTHDAKVKG